jgi:uncharacterized protein YndB with AHSA1/START domain/DNA-binding transcriptional ArsR family regulator
MDDEAIFEALADATRRRLLDLLFERDGRTQGELASIVADGGGPGRFSVMKHVRILEAASLVSTVKVGRERHHYLNPVPIRRIHDRWLEKFTARTADTLLGLQSALENPSMAESTNPPAHVALVYIRATPDEIWRALTDSAYTRRYHGGDFDTDWRPGSPFVQRRGDRILAEGVILEAEPPRRLVMSFTARWDDALAAEGVSRVTWEIADSPTPGVCRLTATHDQLEGKPLTYHDTAEGLPFIVSALKSLLETGHALKD